MITGIGTDFLASARTVERLSHDKTPTNGRFKFVCAGLGSQGELIVLAEYDGEFAIGYGLEYSTRLGCYYWGYGHYFKNEVDALAEYKDCVCFTVWRVSE